MNPMKLALAGALTLAAAPLAAQTPDPKVTELEQKVDALAAELERLKLGEAAPAESGQGAHGYGPAASKVYFSPASKVSIGGYGEFAYQHFAGRNQQGDSSNQHPAADLRRAVLYFGYRFSDRVLFDSEVEFSHGGSGTGSENRGEVAIEQAFLDFKLNDALGARAGLILVPLGLMNEYHEPTTYNGVNRPTVETAIIPTTWPENGAGLFGAWGPLEYRTYAMTALSAVATSDPNPSTDGFTGTSPLGGGKTEGTNSFAGPAGWASRLDCKPFPGTVAGASLYLGQAFHGDVAASVPVSLWDLHAKGEYRGFQLKGLYAQGGIGNAGNLDASKTPAPSATDAAPSRFFGGYLEPSFNVLSLWPATTQTAAVFFRYERFDTQWRMPQGFAKDPANSGVEYTLGVTYKPLEKVALKLDQQWKSNQARKGVNQLNLGIGYIF